MAGSRATSASSARERRARDGIDVSKGAEHEEMAGAELASDELQEQERRRVRGVEVVEHEHERPSLRGAPEELGGRVEEAEARAFGVGRLGLGQSG